MALDDVYILSSRQQMNGVQIVNTFALRCKTATEPTATTFGTTANAIKDLLRQNQVDDLAYVDWVAQKVRGAGVTYNTSRPFRVSTVSFTGAYSAPLAGFATASPAVQSACAVFALLTAQSGRRRKGRFYLAGIDEGICADDGTLDNTARTFLQTDRANALLAMLGPSGTDAAFQLGVWSDRIAMNAALSNTWPRVLTSQGTPDPANAWAAVESIVVRDYVGSQRDRRPGI